MAITSTTPTSMKLSIARIASLAAVCAWMTGCPDDSDQNADADTDADTGTSGDDTDTVDVAITFQEFGSANPIVGASVSVEGATQITDAAGQVTLTLASNGTTAIDVTQPDYPDYIVYVTTLESDLSDTHSLGSDETLATLASALGLTRDPSKGVLSIGVLDGTPDDAGPLPGVMISIDVASEAQLVFDSSADAGFSVGDTTLAGSSSASIFVNVTAGPVTATITPPSGYTCALGPQTIEVAANGYTIANYYCQQ